MFRRSRPVVIDHPGSRRRRRAPRWLLLLLLGAAAGAAAVIYVQERLLPPRLSAAESAALRASFSDADGERQRLRGELAEATQSRDATAAENRRLGDELAAARAAGDRLRDDLAFVAGALPADPRGGAVEIRAASLVRRGDDLVYEVALVRESSRGRPLDALVQLVVSGESARAGETSVSLEPTPTSISAQQVLRGTVRLPAGFVPRHCTIRVVGRPGSELLGMRVMYVR
jgi:hypothetical protein